MNRKPIEYLACRRGLHTWSFYYYDYLLEFLCQLTHCDSLQQICLLVSKYYPIVSKFIRTLHVECLPFPSSMNLASLVSVATRHLTLTVNVAFRSLLLFPAREAWGSPVTGETSLHFAGRWVSFNPTSLKGWPWDLAFIQERMRQFLSTQCLHFLHNFYRIKEPSSKP